jgi:hypothetical protein
MYMLYNCVTYGYDGVAGAVTLILDLLPRYRVTDTACKVVINLPQFRKDFGTLYGRQYIIPASWQLAWNGASLVGLVVGGLLSGMVAEKIGKRYTLAIALGKTVHE